MTQFHPRAMIHPKAQIGAGTIVGADVIIDGEVIIGENCEIRARAVITGHTRLGNDNQIGYGVIIGSEPQDTSYKGAVSFVEIGDRNVFREYATVNRGTSENSLTKVGSDNLFFTGVHIAHNCQVGNSITLVNNVLLAGYVEVRDYAFIGGDAVIHQFNRIGEYVMIRGQTRLSVDVPPYCMAVDTNRVLGLNRVGLRRRGFDYARRKKIQRAFDIFYRQNMNRLQALEAIAQDEELANNPDIAIFCEFIRQTKRGICTLYRKPKWDQEDE